MPPLTDDTLTLLAAARQARAHAYAPYSGFAVGAAVRDDAGRVFAGCNVENAAYPTGLCAESGAISAMVAGGGKQISAILIVGDGPDLVTPCGACRQRIAEFSGRDTLICIAGPDGLRKEFRIDELLPHAFGPANLTASGGAPT